MHPHSSVAAECPARVLALMVAANGRVDERELQALDALDAYRRLGVSRARFIALAHACLHDLGASVCGQFWLSGSDMQVVDALLDQVSDPNQRLLVCRLAAAVITADGRITGDERMVYAHTLARWHITQTMVAHAILHERVT
jgi:hypothetical protein